MNVLRFLIELSEVLETLKFFVNVFDIYTFPQRAEQWSQEYVCRQFCMLTTATRYIAMAKCLYILQQTSCQQQVVL